MRYPDWSEQGTAGTVPGPAPPRPPRTPSWRAARSEVSVDLDVGQPGSQLPDGGAGDSLAVVTKHVEKAQVSSDNSSIFK